MAESQPQDTAIDHPPANTLLQLEENALRATQRQRIQAVPECDYDLNEGHEVVNIDDVDDDCHRQGTCQVAASIALPINLPAKSEVYKD
jgi:hypothetical protein